jgi:hypothetical protein
MVERGAALARTMSEHLQPFSPDIQGALKQSVERVISKTARPHAFTYAGDSEFKSNDTGTHISAIRVEFTYAQSVQRRCLRHAFQRMHLVRCKR